MARSFTRYRWAGALGVAMLALHTAPASAATCTVALAAESPPVTRSCTANATGFAVVNVKGIVRLTVTCNGVPYFDNIIGTTYVVGTPGPCSLTVTLTPISSASVTYGMTF